MKMFECEKEIELDGLKVTLRGTPVPYRKGKTSGDGVACQDEGGFMEDFDVILTFKHLGFRDGKLTKDVEEEIYLTEYLESRDDDVLNDLNEQLYNEWCKSE